MTEIIVLIAVIIAAIAAANSMMDNAKNALQKSRNELATAKHDYDQAIELLKRSPSNPDLKQRALQAGRKYSALTRKGKVAIYDEVAIKNDIDAACAAASPQVTSAASQVSTNETKNRLHKLKELHDSGIINNEEYAARRQKILDEV